MSLLDQLNDNLTSAVKDQREPDRTVLRGLLAAIRNAEIDNSAPLDDAGITKILQKQLKQREESAVAYESRPELAAKEEAEAKLIAAYLPEPLSEAELTELVEAAISETGAVAMSDMGKVMGSLNPKVAGRADGGAIAAIVKAKLG